MSRRNLEGSYARLRGLRDSLMLQLSPSVSLDFKTDYEHILSTLRDSCDDEFLGFDLPSHTFRNHTDPLYQVNKAPVSSKIQQLLSYLENVHNASNRIVEIGSVYNLIKDEELKSRCSDLLSARDHFDRVINQATLVLEDRIKEKVPQFASDSGASLINKAIKQEPSKSVIVFSEDANEQQGYASLFRGIIAVFRNPSHHKLLDNVTREEALQICAFIDNLMRLLGTASVSD